MHTRSSKVLKLSGHVTKNLRDAKSYSVTLEHDPQKLKIALDLLEIFVKEFLILAARCLEILENLSEFSVALDNVPNTFQLLHTSQNFEIYFLKNLRLSSFL